MLDSGRGYQTVDCLPRVNIIEKSEWPSYCQANGPHRFRRNVTLVHRISIGEQSDSLFYFLFFF